MDSAGRSCWRTAGPFDAVIQTASVEDATAVLTEVVHLDGRRNGLSDADREKLIESFPIERVYAPLSLPISVNAK